MEKVEPRFPWVHPLQHVLWQGSRIDRTYFDIKTADNTNINHIMVSFNDHYNAISVDRLPSKTKIEKYWWKRFRKIILFYVSPSSPQLQRLLFLLKTQEITTLEQVTGGNTPNFVLKRILRLKKTLQFQERICFFY